MASNSLLECVVFAKKAAEHIYSNYQENKELIKEWDISKVTETQEGVIISSSQGKNFCAGEIKTALLAGGEALYTQKNAQRKGVELNWNEDLGYSFKEWGIKKRGWSDIEDKHGMKGAIFAYPLIENAIRGKENRTIEEHNIEMGKMNKNQFYLLVKQ